METLNRSDISRYTRKENIVKENKIVDNNKYYKIFF